MTSQAIEGARNERVVPITQTKQPVMIKESEKKEEEEKKDEGKKEEKK